MRHCPSSLRKENFIKTTSALLDRKLRKIIPSLSLLTYKLPFKIFVNGMDILPNWLCPQFRKLPPNHLRIRVGVGNNLFANQHLYLSTHSFWTYCLTEKLVTLDSNIVDIGCGCGRFAHPLRDYNFKGSRFRGKYTGVDIDPELLQWCSENFDADRFQFAHSTHASKSYQQAGSATSYALPVESGSIDFIFSTSLFTHLLEPELRNYYEESFRALKPGGHMFMFCFCLDHPPSTMGTRHTFSHAIGNARVESLKVPEAAVAYSESFLVELAQSVGFRSAKMIGLTSEDDLQAILVAEK